ncbi:MAG: hypothetical protein HQK87_00425 [Nitrospinae bacterium]|nr:hypothetical protein [Nitrospinota bacterium]
MSLRYFSVTGSPELIKEPVLFTLVKRHGLTVNVYRAHIDQDKSWIIVSLDGSDAAVDAAILDITCRGAIAAEGGIEMLETGEPTRVITLRVRLTFPPSEVKKPVFTEIVRRFNVVINVRRAAINNDRGWADWEIAGPVDEVDAALAAVRQTGVGVAPVEGNVIE